jgi:hypothetical protein
MDLDRVSMVSFEVNMYSSILPVVFFFLKLMDGQFGDIFQNVQLRDRKLDVLLRKSSTSLMFRSFLINLNS